MVPPVLVDPAVWRACAGCNVKIPSVGSSVFYFPEGHGQCKIDTESSSTSRQRRPCRVVSINYMVDPKTDDVFARITLDPNLLPIEAAVNPNINPPPEALNSCSKILTASDANNGGGFSVPRLCADTIFPFLDFKIDNPAQQLNIRDLAGEVYSFRHIYRGTPKRHLLTSGWSKFVNKKELVAGDNVIFVKKSPQEIFIGVQHKDPVKKEEVEMVPVAADGIFEVDYYPGNGEGFLVEEEAVTEAMKVGWSPGMRVRMMEEMGRAMWHAGTVARVEGAMWHTGTVERVEVGPRPWSPWKMLKIKWDEKEVMQSMQNVSPWQVEMIPATMEPKSPNLAVKKTKVLQISNPVPTDLPGAGHNFNNNNDPNNNDRPFQPENVAESDEVVQNRISSPHGQESISNDHNPTERCKSKAFKLFGQIIYPKE